jgi:FKBP-type peptidyl-prolyl cis-trans isomerase FkpA
MRRLLRWAPLVVGIALFAAAVARFDLHALARMSASLGVALPVVILINGVSQLLRTLTWRFCFPPGVARPFRRLLRIRLAAEAFSYVTVSGVAGEPLKVVLLKDEAPAPAVTASVILERLSFSIVTLALVGVWAAVTLMTMPLAPYWRDMFFWFAFVAALFILLIVAAVRGEGTYMSRFLEWLTRRTRGLLGGHAAGRFLVQAERQLLEFARTDRRRVLRVVALDAVNYALMAAEVWVVLRAVGAASSFATALTIETFTRVVSIVFAPVPGSLGALEASHLAVASAVGLAPAGAALAVARRARGLFWAGVGFAVYPRRVPHAQRTGVTLLYLADSSTGSARPGQAPSTRDVRARQALVSPMTRIGGLPIAERVLRAAARDGCARLNAWAPRSADDLRAVASRIGGALPPLVLATTDAEWIEAINAERPAGSSVRVIGPGSIPGHALSVQRQEDVPAAELALRRAVFKPTDGVLARFNRRISLPISLVLIRTPVTANQISLAIVGLGLWAAWLFSRGSYAASLIGACVSLAASILDGCDGEVARLKYQESVFGCWLETVGDYTYYFAIFIGITIGAVRSTGHRAFYDLGFAALGGSLVTAFLLLLLRQRMTATRPERFGAAGKAHFVSGGAGWARFLAWLSVCATRAVMPYGILMLAIAGLTPLVIVFAAIGANVYWLALTSRLRTLLTVPIRVALVVAIALSAAACGGGSESSPSNTPAPPSAPFSATDLREGTGATATQGRTVTVQYTGWLYDPARPESKGTQFDSSMNFSFQLGVGRVIAGWDQGVVGMKVGGQRRLVIPPNLAYGSQMINSIPPNSTLVFDVMLLAVN